MYDFIFLLPGLKQTGGPESIHNLFSKISCLGYSCAIATKFPPLQTPIYFSQYKPVYISLDAAFSANCTCFILPEVHTYLIHKLPKSSLKFVWWLSLVNHTNSLSPIYKFKNYGINSIFKSNPLTFSSLNNVFHLFQTDSSRSFVCNKYGNQLYFRGILLESPINEIFYSSKIPVSFEELRKRPLSVALNPAKIKPSLLSIYIKFFECRGYKVILLKNLNRNQLIDTLSKTMFYLDFGPHPGQERLPREAIMLGCLPVVATNGTASNYLDLHLPYFLKINRSNASLFDSLQYAHHLFMEIYHSGLHLQHYIDFQDYSYLQQERFESNLNDFIHLHFQE